MRILSFFSFLLAALLIAVSGCKKDPLNNDSNAKLAFSRDTVVFDTVFTTVGSATRQFKVYNFSSRTVKISSVRLAGGNSSPFHLNVDGVPCVSTSDIYLHGGDSMYVFVDVTIDPNNSNSPLMVEDSVLFETNGNKQAVILNAVGQDAYFHYYATLNCNEVWTNDKPHVIYGYAIIPATCMLTIQAGARVYLHHNAVLAADSAATLKVQGAHGNEVTFQGDRLEPDYAEEPGQWGYIWLSSLSVNSSIDWAIIKNGTIGVLSDSITGPNPTVKITNTKIRNMTLAGIYGRDSWIEGDNDLVTNCADYCCAIAYGGKCKFRHCTFGDYWNIDTRTTPAVLLNNWYKESDNVTINRRDLVQADFINCIIYGDQTNEIGLDSNVTSGVQFNYMFSHCDIKTNVSTSNPSHFNTNIINADPLFVDYAANNMHLNPGSPARGIADSSVSALVPFDLDTNNRLMDGFPDAGCYEGQ